MRRPAAKNKPRQAQLKSFPAPVAGWIANQNLARPNVSLDGRPTGQGAAVLDNWFPTATSAILRRGSERYATLGDGSLSVTALFSYVAGSQEELFAANDEAIYNVTTVAIPEDYSFVDDEGDEFITDEGDTFGEASTAGLDVMSGFTGGAWSVVQFATSGGVFLVGVNGEDFGFRYDGTMFYPTFEDGVFALEYESEVTSFTEGSTLTGGTSGATATIYRVTEDTLWLTDIVGGPFEAETITDSDGGEALATGAETLLAPGIDGQTTDNLSFVWSYKNRLFFVERDSLDAWYLDVNEIAGTLTKLPLGAVFPRGGSLLFGATWSLDSGAEGGLSEQCVFVTTQGEVAVYQGDNPSDAAAWQKVGVYRIGRPLGARAIIRAGGDLVIATTIGFVPLSQAIKRDVAALSPSSVSFPIEVAWNEAVERRAGEWNCEVWPDAQMVLVAPPVASEDVPSLFVANARTGAWSRFTNWAATCMEVFRGRLFFGSTEGRVVEANIGGLDEGAPYTGAYIPLFDDLRSPGSLKIAQMARSVVRSAVAINGRMSCQVDYNITLPPPPFAEPVPAGSQWGNGIWGESVWSVPADAVLSQRWTSIGGSGYALAPSIQITSGSIVPLDAELIRTDLTFETADIVS